MISCHSTLHSSRSSSWVPRLDNNTITLSTVVTAESDLSIVKTGDGSPVTAGESTTFTIEVANAGISDDPATIEFLRSFGDELRFLFITSQVSFGAVTDQAFVSEAVPGLRVEVHRADGEKCERCWNYTTDVGVDAAWDNICGRCSGHVREILGEANPA